MSIVCVDPGTDALWRRLTEGRPTGAFSSPAWVRVLTETYGLDVRAWVLLDETGEPTAGIPFCRVSDIMGERIVSLPFSDYCDPVVSDAADWHELVQRLLSEGCPVFIRCLHNRLPGDDERFAVPKRARWHAIDVRPELATLWHSLHESSKRAIQKAQRCGVVVRPASGAAELRVFHDMHVKLRKYKYRLLAQPYAFFVSIWQQFLQNQQGQLLLAMQGDRILGGVMLLDWQGSVYYKFNASVPEELGHRPNDLLMWESIKYARSRNASYLDLGLSDWDQEGLIRYKRKFATDEGIISFVQYSPDLEQLHRQTAARAVFGQLTSTFTSASVPDEVSRTAGELLYRFLA
jgi:CelD/BcsL family acetyltransferase involved in cellulose biosynthesis